jgi:hypothetical protein
MRDLDLFKGAVLGGEQITAEGVIELLLRGEERGG